MDGYCDTTAAINIGIKDWITEHRLTAFFLYITAVNVVYNHLMTKIVPEVDNYIHLSRQEKGMLPGRYMQLLFGPVIAIPGYACLLYQALTGCDTSIIYCYANGGFVLAVLDAHEYIRAWPLKGPVLAHHLGVFFVCLCFVEYQVLPVSLEEPIPASFILLLANVGVVWVTDFFHAIYRTHSSLKVIKLCKNIFLGCVFFRAINIGIFCHLTYKAGSISGKFFLGFMTFAYIFINFRAIKFVVKFNCERYFLSHQAKWAALNPQGDEMIDAKEANSKGDVFKTDHRMKKHMS